MSNSNYEFVVVYIFSFYQTFFIFIWYLNGRNDVLMIVQLMFHAFI